MSQPEEGQPQSAVGPVSVATPDLQRVTTRFHAAQDRICLSGELPGGHVVLWLTQRMLRRLLPVVVDWLANHDPMNDLALPSGDLYREALQGFAQQAARTQLEQLPAVAPVSVGADSPEYLVSSVQVERSAQCLRMVFSTEQSPIAQMALYPQSLRQWLNILFDAWRRADWPVDLWPAWMHDDGALSVQTPSAPLH